MISTVSFGMLYPLTLEPALCRWGCFVVHSSCTFMPFASCSVRRDGAPGGPFVQVDVFGDERKALERGLHEAEPASVQDLGPSKPF